MTSLRTLGAYQLVAPLAQGGTAELFLARHTGTGGVDRLVVVKQLLPELAEDPEYVTMFLDEARLGAKLFHPNIVYTLDLGHADGRAFIALEYLEGMTVGQLAARARERVAGGLPIELAVAMVRDAARGLHAAHEARMPDGTALAIVHRDVSPQNIVATYGGEVKVVDFGIAHAAVREAKTRTGMIKGKYAYMSPEQCRAQPVDRRTDVFALGVVLYELTTQARLFKRKNSYDTFKAILRGAVTPPSQVNRGIDRPLEAAMLRALSPAREARHPTAAALADELEAWLIARGLGPTTPMLAPFYERHFATELAEHRVRLAALRAGQPAPLVAETWDDEPGSQRSSSGPDERTRMAKAPRPTGLDVRLDAGQKALLVLGAVVVLAVAVAGLLRLLG